MPIPVSMPVSRPLLIALGAAMLALVAFFASSAMRGSETTSAPEPKPAEAAAPKPSKPDIAQSKPSARPEPAKADPSSSVKADPPKAGAPKAAQTSAGVPGRVQRAVQGGRTVVLFFYQRGGADDSATARSVAALRGRRGVAVFTAPVSRLGDFRAVTGKLGISQAPAVVIVGRKGKDGSARVVEGYVDPQTLAQEVADSR